MENFLHLYEIGCEFVPYPHRKYLEIGTMRMGLKWGRNRPKDIRISRHFLWNPQMPVLGPISLGDNTISITDAVRMLRSSLCKI